MSAVPAEVTRNAIPEAADAQFFPDKPLWTPEIGRKAGLVASCVSGDEPGLHIWGIQGAGKSHFAEYVQAVLPSMLGGTVVTFLWSFLGIKPKNAEELLKHCLPQTGCRAIGTRERTQLELRMEDAIARRCDGSGANRALFIVDEMQNVSHELHGVFMSIMARMRPMRTCLLSIGQPEMQQGIELLHLNNSLQHIWRLFPITEVYHSLSLEDIKEFLTNLDGPDREFTKLWFPNRADDGWSIVDMSGPIDLAVAGLLKDRNLAAAPRVPFGYLRPALNNMFRQMRDPKLSMVDFGQEHALTSFKAVRFDRVINRYVEINAQ
jgi:hypothetical protein